MSKSSSTNDQPAVIRLGTRASKLAMWQSNWVKQQLESAGVEVELIQIQTQGDVKTGPLSQIGGQGLFTKQLQVALLENEIDLAVHSLKDLPTDNIPGLEICAIPLRETTSDALVAKRGVVIESLDDLPHGATVGTGSVRRAAQLLHLRGDLKTCDLRGNVDTRLKKLDDGSMDAIVLASAGLTRLGWANRISYEFLPQQMLPAVGQGALGLEVRSADDAVQRMVEKLNHRPSYGSAMAERVMLQTLFAGCLAPVGARTIIKGEQLTLEGVVLGTGGKTRIFESATRPLDEHAELGAEVAQRLIDGGADKLLRPKPEN